MLHKLNIELDEVFDKISSSMREHSIRVGELLCLMVNGDNILMNMYGFETSEELNTALNDAGLYHDVGKILYSPVLAGKKKTLEKLYEVSDRLHPMCSGMIIEQFGEGIWLSEGHKRIVMEAARYHHERHNGCGYPNGLKGKEIPMGGSLCSIANFIDNTMIGNSGLNPSDFERKMERISALVGLWNNPVAVEYFEKTKLDIINFYCNEVLKDGVKTR